MNKSNQQTAVMQEDPSNSSESKLKDEHIDEQQEDFKLEFLNSPQLTSWMETQQVSFAVSTYQFGQVFFLGLNKNGRLSIFNRGIPHCFGLCNSNQSLYISSIYQLYRFQNVLLAGQMYGDYDRYYVPQVSYITGNIDMHDIAIDKQGRPIFVNTLFSCLATVSETHSFTPLWKPTFISKLAPEDRCHLNGLAMEEGEPRYVTAISETDTKGGWRDHRESGGIVIDVKSNKVILNNLSMPHSPRIHQGKLWLLDSGSGYLGYVNFNKNKKAEFVPYVFCPGFLRGLAFVGDYAIVGASKQRQNRNFSGLALDDNLKKAGVEPRCGLMIVDLKKGDLLHTFYFEGIIEELYDVVAFSHTRNPAAIGFKSDEIRHHLSVPNEPLE